MAAASPATTYPTADAPTALYARHKPATCQGAGRSRCAATARSFASRSAAGDEGTVKNELFVFDTLNTVLGDTPLSRRSAAQVLRAPGGAMRRAMPRIRPAEAAGWPAPPRR